MITWRICQIFFACVFPISGGQSDGSIFPSDNTDLILHQCISGLRAVLQAPAGTLTYFYISSLAAISCRVQKQKDVTCRMTHTQNIFVCLCMHLCIWSGLFCVFSSQVIFQGGSTLPKFSDSRRKSWVSWQEMLAGFPQRSLYLDICPEGRTWNQHRKPHNPPNPGPWPPLPPPPPHTHKHTHTHHLQDRSCVDIAHQCWRPSIINIFSDGCYVYDQDWPPGGLTAALRRCSSNTNGRPAVVVITRPNCDTPPSSFLLVGVTIKCMYTVRLSGSLIG